MSPRARQILIILAGATLLALLASGVQGLAPFGHYPGPYGDVVTAAAPSERHILNVITSVMFDYRGFDTLGEEFILFASVTGVVLLLRDEKWQHARRDHGGARTPHVGRPERGEAIGWFGTAAVALVWAFGCYVVVTGHLTVGGGFQGGVILSAGWVLVYVCHGGEALERVGSSTVLEWFEAVGACGYVIVGLVGLLAGRPFLTNTLPLGHTGQLVSSGTPFVLDLTVATEVAAGFVLLLGEFARPFRPASS